MERFGKTNEDERKRVINEAVAENTVKKSQWAMRIFRSWLTEWRVRIDDKY